jgi:hypothetical protein
VAQAAHGGHVKRKPSNQINRNGEGQKHPGHDAVRPVTGPRGQRPQHFQGHRNREHQSEQEPASPEAGLVALRRVVFHGPASAIAGTHCRLGHFLVGDHACHRGNPELLRGQVHGGGKNSGDFGDLVLDL